MRKPLLPLMLLALLALATGCQSGKSARAKPRYRTIENSYTDQAARSEYVERRTNELKQMGLKDADALARASREWFSHAGVAAEVPTKYELQRREAEADIRTYLDQRDESGGR